MSINVVPGFKAGIQVEDKQGLVLYQRSFFSSGEMKTFLREHSTSKNSTAFNLGIAFLLRTDTCPVKLRDFSDMTAPFTKYSESENIESDHPIGTLIADNPHSEQAMKKGKVRLRYELKTTEIYDVTYSAVKKTGQIAQTLTVKGVIDVALRSFPGKTSSDHKEERKVQQYAKGSEGNGRSGIFKI